MPRGKYQKKTVNKPSSPKKNVLKIAIWAIALLATTTALGAGYTVFSQAFGAEDKASAVELCRFGAKDVTSFEQMRSVTTTSGNHIFLQSNVKYANGSKAGLIAFKETVTEDPCQGMTNLTSVINGQPTTDISTENWALADWELMNAVFVPDIDSDNDDNGYITVFLREKTNNYTKQLSLALLKYTDGTISFVRSMPAFANNENFSSIINALYSYEAGTLYVFGATESEGVRGRGLHLASISHEDLLRGAANYFYCSPTMTFESANSCTWNTDSKKSKPVIATKEGEMDVVGLDDSIALLLQNDGKKVMVYDLATSGAIWNPGIQLLDCAGTTICEQITMYDYQMSLFENAEEQLKLMTFNFIQALDGQAILYEATIKDYTISEVTADAIIPDFEMQTVSALRTNENGSVGTKSRPAPPKVNSTTTPVKKKADSTGTTTGTKGGKSTADDRTYETTITKQKSLASKVADRVGGKSTTAVTVAKRSADRVTPTKMARTPTPTPTKTANSANGKAVTVQRVNDAKAAEKKTLGLDGGRISGRSTVVHAPATPQNGLAEVSRGRSTGVYRPPVTGTKGDPTAVLRPTTTRLATGSADCPKGWTFNYRTKECVEPVVLTTKVSTVAERNTCNYGNLTNANSEYCKKMLPNCGSSAKIKSNCTTGTATGALYSEYKKCVDNGSVTSCCPANTTLQNGKCVEYVDLDEIDPVTGKKVVRCKPGEMLDKEKKYCVAALQNCDIPEVDMNECSSTQQLQYAALKSCKSGTKVLSCCPKGKENVNGKCVTPQ